MVVVVVVELDDAGIRGGSHIHVAGVQEGVNVVNICVYISNVNNINNINNINYFQLKIEIN